MPAPVAGVDGAWACPHCGNVNFKVRTACNRCQRPREESPAEAVPQFAQVPSQPYNGSYQKGPAPVAGVDGNWSCPHCQNVNFPGRTACNRCQAPKPVPQAVVPPPTHLQRGAKGGPVAGVDGNWECPMCRNVNYRMRDVCNMCQAAKPTVYSEAAATTGSFEHDLAEKTAEINWLRGELQQAKLLERDLAEKTAENYRLRAELEHAKIKEADLIAQLQQFAPPVAHSAPPKGSPPVAGVNGNWECPSCRNVNLHWREVCNLCHQPKPAGAVLDDLGLAAQPPQHPPALAHTPRSGPPQAGVDGNWSCPLCLNVNYGIRTACNKCQAPRPAETPPSLSANDYDGYSSLAPMESNLPKKGPQAGVDGNWACPHCNNVNFAYRTECNKCGAPKPEGIPQPARRPSGAPIAGVDGNWQCLKCTNVNFAMRDICNRCQEPKPQEHLLSDEDLFNELAQPGSTLFEDPPAKRTRF